MDQEPKLTADTLAHQREHSLEVMLPFLAAINPQTRIVPICVSHPGLETLLAVGRSVGTALRGFPRSVSILVSSDMSHFVHHELAKQLDAQALAPALALDPARFYETVRGEGISMVAARARQPPQTFSYSHTPHLPSYTAGLRRLRNCGLLFQISGKGVARTSPQTRSR